MVPQRVEASAAAACAGAERQGKTQPTKQENPELWAGDSHIVGGGEDRDSITRPGCGLACESSRARDAGERSVKCVSSTRSSQARLAQRCQPRR